MTYAKEPQFIAAINYIYAHINQPLSLNEIAQNSHCSPATLKRLFKDITNQGPGQFIRRLRMEFAYQQLQQREASVLEIALHAGFDDHSAFSRAFKKCFGQSPRLARTTKNIISELDAIRLNEPDFISIDTIELQIATETGSYFDAAPKAWQALATALPHQEEMDEFTGLLFGIGHDNPHHNDISPAKVRFSAGVSLATPSETLQRFNLAAGDYARFDYHGKPMNLGLAYHYIFGCWHESNGQGIDHNKLAFTVFDHLPQSGIADEKLQIWVPLLA